MAQPAPEALDPSRPPHWRWVLATDLAEARDGRFRRCGDAATRSAKRFWLSWVRCRDEGDRRRLAARMPATAQAFSIFSDPRGMSRTVLEARILAAEAPAAIARKCAAPLPLIQIYERVFFDVRDRLDASDYVLTHAIGRGLREGTGSYDAALKLLAYLGGVHVLDEIMGARSAASRPAAPREVGAFLTEDARAAVRAQMAVVARMLGATDRRTAAVLAAANARQATGKANEDDISQDRLLVHVQAMLDAIPWAVGPEGAKKTHPRLAEFDRYAAELRDDQLLLVASGQEPAGLAAELKDLQMPPPRPREGGLPK